jgi:transposase-like protein
MFASDSVLSNTATCDLNVRLVSVTCPHCRRSHEGDPRTSLLGFRRYSCWRCLSDFRYPLHRRYRIAYWTILVASTTGMLVTHGRPNAFMIAAAVALLWDGWMMLRRH